MESTYYFIIVGVLLFEYALSTISSTLNMSSITEDIPDGFQDYYDKDKYAKSQSYLKDKTRFGLFTGTFSLCLTLVIIHAGLFGLLDDFVLFWMFESINNIWIFRKGLLDYFLFFQDVDRLAWLLHDLLVFEQ